MNKKDRQAKMKEYFSSKETIKKLFEQANKEDYISLVREGIAKMLAVNLRALLINTNSPSLFTQLGLNEKVLFEPVCTRLIDTPGNLVFTYSLLTICLEKEKKFICKAVYSENKTDLRCTLNCWLNEIVIDSKQESIPKVSRKDIILALADKEGGAHFDENYDDQYYNVVFNSGFEAVDQNGVVTKIQNNYYVETFYAIVCEFINALEEHDNLLAKSNYERGLNDLSVIQLIYQDSKEIKRYRFIYNGGKNLPNSILGAYDYTEIAKYKFMFTQNYIFRIGNIKFGRRIIDERYVSDMFFYMDGGNISLFIRHQNKFARIMKHEDIYKLESCKHYSMSQAINLYRNEDMDFLYSYLDKQKTCAENYRKRIL